MLGDLDIFILWKFGVIYFYNSVNYYIWISYQNISRPLVIITNKIELRPVLLNNATSHLECRPDLLGLWTTQYWKIFISGEN